jgi:hypothetical protein
MPWNVWGSGYLRDMSDQIHTPTLSPSGKASSAPTGQAAAWAPEQMCMLWIREKSLLLLEIEPRFCDRPERTLISTSIDLLCLGRPLNYLIKLRRLIVRRLTTVPKSVLTRARNWSLSSARWIQSTPPTLFFLNLSITSSHLRRGLPSGSFPYYFLSVFLPKLCPDFSYVLRYSTV